jgi:hypothetical protein
MKLFSIAALLVIGTAGALANLVVSNNSDAGAGSLRQAVLDAQAHGGGTITFSSVQGTVALLSSLPAVTNTIIVGPGAAQLTVSTAAATVLTNLPGSTAYISGLTLMGSNGVLHNLGTLTLNECIVAGGYTTSAPGAGVRNAGALILNRCTISGNASYGGGPGAGIYNSGRMSLNNCAVTNNRVTVMPGAGIYNAGAATLNNCNISSNYGTGGNDSGGGIYNAGDMDLHGCILTNNSVVFGDGGGIYNSGLLTLDSCTLAGNHFSGNGAGGGIYNSAGTVVLSNCSITNNTAVDPGGGLWNSGWLHVLSSTISGNVATYSDGPIPGGGILNNGTAILVNATVSGNSALSTGAGIHNTATLTLLNSTIVSNRVWLSEGVSAGGGVWNSGTVQTRNSIFAWNTSLQGPDLYGAIDSDGFNLIQNTNDCSITGVTTGNLSGADPLLGPLRDNGGPTWTHALMPGSPAIDAGTSDAAPGADQRGVPRPQGLAVDIGSFEFENTVPMVKAITLISSSNVCMRSWGMPGAAYTLESSSDLVHWFNVTNFNAGPNGLWEFVDNDIKNYPVRFFRVQSPGP